MQQNERIYRYYSKELFNRHIQKATNGKNKVQKLENEILSFEQEVYDTDILSNKVEVAILKLPERYKQVFFLKYSHGVHDDKIAEILDISPSTVRTRIKRGKEKLKIILDEMEKVHG